MTMTTSLDPMAWLPTLAMSVTAAAEAYITNGLRVCIVHGVVDGKCTCERRVCPKPGKHPVIASWQKKRYASSNELHDALNSRRMPEEPNLGIVMGEQLDGTHLLAIDVDIASRLVELEDAIGPLPPTLTSRSGGGGAHRLFVLGSGQDPKRLKNRTGVRLSTEDPSPGVDVRWTGGQIVVSPSIHESGGQYEWADRLPIATLPQAWFDLIAEPVDGPKTNRPLAGSGNVYTLAKSDRYLETVIENACRDISSRGKGERNSVLFAKACTVLEHCAGAGISFDRAVPRLRDAGVACGLPRGEVTETLRKAERQVRSSGRTRTPPEPEAPHSRRALAASVAPSAPDSAPLVDPKEEPVTEEVNPTASPDPKEMGRLSLIVERGKYDGCVANVITILAQHSMWRGVLQYDMFREAIVFTRPPPCRPQDAPLHRPQGNTWLETDDSRTQAWLHEHAGFNVGKNVIADAVAAVAERSAVHPVKDYLASLVWDGDERLPTMFANYFGASPNAYTAGIGMCWMISAIARVTEPGCQADYMIGLEGPQGLGKSSGLRALCPNASWYADTGVTIGQKDSYLALHGKWIFCFDELDSVRGSDVTKTKAFLTSRSDNFRPPWGRRNRDYLRQTIFAYTTNESVYLRDRTGNRRWWPVVCGRIDVDAIRRDRDQLWAEACVRYARGERWYPDTELNRLCAEQQGERMVDDPWSAIVEEWLETDAAKRILSRDTGSIATHDILLSALGKPARDISRADEMRVGEVLRELGWVAQRTQQGGKRQRRYLHPTHAYKVGQVGHEVGQE